MEPEIVAFPFVIEFSLIIECKKVVLPIPCGPTTASKFPFFKLRLIPTKTKSFSDNCLPAGVIVLSDYTLKPKDMLTSSYVTWIFSSMSPFVS